MFKEIGARLRERRRELNLGLEEVVEKTKLSPSAIKAIEDGDVKRLTSTYAKGFIRIYAAFLNVDLAEYDIDAVHTKVEIGENRKKSLFSDNDKSNETDPKNKIISAQKIISSAGKFKPQVKPIPVPAGVKKTLIILLAAVVGIFVVAAIVKTISQKIHEYKIAKLEKELAQKAGEKDPFDKPAFLTSKTDKNKKETKTKTLVQSADEAQPQAMPQSAVVKELKVSLTAKRTCGVKAKVDGKTLFDGLLRKGAVETWKGSKAIDLRIQDGSAVYIEVNGKSLPSLTKMHRAIKSLKVTPAGITINK